MYLKVFLNTAMIVIQRTEVEKGNTSLKITKEFQTSFS
jgi:hypothetical protein